MAAPDQTPAWLNSDPDLSDKSSPCIGLELAGKAQN
jgi:hypothetical protein